MIAGQMLWAQMADRHHFVAMLLPSILSTHVSRLHRAMILTRLVCFEIDHYHALFTDVSHRSLPGHRPIMRQSRPDRICLS